MVPSKKCGMTTQFAFGPVVGSASKERAIDIRRLRRL